MRVRNLNDKIHWVRIEELLPCPRFVCCHEAMSCATSVLCPNGTFDSNKYYSVCRTITCMDCMRYIRGKGHCTFGGKHPKWNYRKRERWGRPRW